MPARFTAEVEAGAEALFARRCCSKEGRAEGPGVLSIEIASVLGFQFASINVRGDTGLPTLLLVLPDEA